MKKNLEANLENTYSEQNEMIAQFVGAKKQYGKYDLYSVPCMNNVFADVESDDPDAKHYYASDEMKFHSSWDWIMAAVEVINSMKDEWGNHYHFQLGNGYVWVEHNIGDRIFFSGNEIGHRDEPMILKVFRGVVAFIEWYKTKQMQNHD